MENKNQHIEINLIKHPYLAKCNTCNRVKDLFYKAIIYSVEPDGSKHRYIMGDLSLCKECGDNLAKALGHELMPNEQVLKEFRF